MKLKRTALWLAATAFLLLAVVLIAQPTVAQSGPNLFTNPGFEEGHHHQDGIAEITVPDGWHMYWVDAVTFPGAFNDLVAHRPETVVWNATGGVPVGEEVFWRDGIFTLKIFKSWAPMYAAISQDVSGLEVGRHYLVVAPVYTDIYDWDGGKIPPTDSSHGQVRLGASPVGAGWRDEAAIAYSGWFASTYAGYGIFSYEFTATQSDMTVWIEVKGTYPHSNNGFFIDTVGLYALDSVSAVTNPGGGSTAPVVPAGPTSTPLPPPTPRPDGAIYHTVQGDDTLWVIAVQYASVMNMTPEEALPRIQELNNNPAFISVGQELLIVPPQENVTPPVVEEATPEATPEATAESESTGTEEGTAESTGPDTSAALASPEGGAGDEAAAPEPTEAVIAPVTNSICVSVFNDGNGDKTYNQGSETVLADAAVTLTRGGNTVGTYVSDGVSESHCFDSLEPDTYQVQFFPPAGYQTTTDGSWAVVASGGALIPVNFGAQLSTAGSEEVAAVDTAVSAPETTTTDETTDTAAAPETAVVEDSGLPIGTIVIGVAVFLVVLAAIGVVLLRRA
ncbi:MAG: hypothetical protein R3E31_03875 [Chloroflexota bacterium]